MANRPATPAILVGLDLGVPCHDDYLAEARELLGSAHAHVVETISGSRQKPDASTFAGKGKVAEIAAAVIAHNAKLVMFNHQLSSAQIRNLERLVGVRVIDRTDLILEIFAQRAKSAEGKLQVELALAEHSMTRLVKAWSHLEKQQGGIGNRGGPGEKQLEIDRQLVRKRIKLLKQRLQKVQQQRHTQRQGRVHAKVFSISIVGYTNAGKSTLFNRLTHANSYVADKLFATLDTTTRKLFLDNDVSVSLSDTVGFIRDLPHGLVAAFRATLEEAVNADLLLHVVDASNPLREQQIEDVNKVLAEIGAEHALQLRVVNKCDLLPENVSEASMVRRDEYGKIAELKVSALTGVGLPALRLALTEYAQLNRAFIDADSRADSNFAPTQPLQMLANRLAADSWSKPYALV